MTDTQKQETKNGIIKALIAGGATLTDANILFGECLDYAKDAIVGNPDKVRLTRDLFPGI